MCVPHMWRSEGNSLEWALFFYVALDDETQVLGTGGKCSTYRVIS